MTMKTKGADASKDLYFAEVMCMRGDYEAHVLTCICMVKPDDNGISYAAYYISELISFSFSNLFVHS
jgi:hypothetical protein